MSDAQYAGDPAAKSRTEIFGLYPGFMPCGLPIANRNSINMSQTIPSEHDYWMIAHSRTEYSISPRLKSSYWSLQSVFSCHWATLCYKVRAHDAATENHNHCLIRMITYRRLPKASVNARSFECRKHRLQRIPKRLMPNHRGSNCSSFNAGCWPHPRARQLPVGHR